MPKIPSLSSHHYVNTEVNKVSKFIAAFGVPEVNRVYPYPLDLMETRGLLNVSSK